MRNIFLDERTARDIDRVVAKVLRDLENPEPPLRLELVREVLSLDRAYYSSTDTSVLEETVHRLLMAGKQLIKRPTLLLDVVRKRKLSALWAPDRRRILLDAEVPEPKQRWNEGHEIGHSLIPWHEQMLHGDKDRTLRFTCEERLEAEANLAAGRLLFLRDAFAARFLDGPITFDRVKDLCGEFGNTMTSGLWRVVENLDMPAFGLVSQHPRRPSHPEAPMVRYFLRSRAFEKQFAGVDETQIFSALGRFCFRNRGPIGSDEVVLRDAGGIQHVFFVETFFNGHEALTLGVYRRLHALVVAVP